MNEHVYWNLSSQLKKKLNRGIELLAKIRHFTPKHLLNTLYFSLFNSNFTYQLKVNNFKIEKYGCKEIVNKCTLDWNSFQQISKQNFQMMKRSH